MHFNYTSVLCVRQGQLPVAPQHLCPGLLHHHAAGHGSPLDKAGVQRRREGLCPSHHAV